ncbi:putative sal-like protein 3 [Scophthalmus maximus]|uniref:Putative sal-like protein 3 n=1 Tax=Scophthalmus maximus TaxID=52904 RepID=A0A2U9B0Z5_SCOMX|nr:putative sal-like protein 3 [Scophthalmus maximus]
MSRRKQKRPQHLVNADPGGPRLLSHDDHLGIKSPSTSLGSETFLTLHCLPRLIRLLPLVKPQVPTACPTKEILTPP